MAALWLGGCAHYPADRIQNCGSASSTHQMDSASGTASATLSVLTYNVEGLPWPIRSGREASLREIERQLAEMRRQGHAPDIVLLQEAFTSAGARIAAGSGYPNFAHGPTAGQRQAATSADASPSLVSRRRLLRGERTPGLMPSGLLILSTYPIEEVERQPFRRNECAGYDCLANKGVMRVRIHVPGVPEPIDIYNAHLNSRRSAGVPDARSRAAHALQVDHLSDFLSARRDEGAPMIFGGDLNMRGAPDRFAHFANRVSFPLVHQYCPSAGNDCDAGISFSSHAPWLETQDQQGFADGRSVSVRPISMTPMFDAPWRGRRLSDHDGLLVVYRLSWQTAAGPALASACDGGMRIAQRMR